MGLTLSQLDYFAQTRSSPPHTSALHVRHSLPVTLIYILILLYLHTHTQAYTCSHTQTYSASRPHAQPSPICTPTLILSLGSNTHVDVTETSIYPKTEHTHLRAHTHTHPHSPALSSSQLCLIFLQHMKARATSSATRQTESPTVTHRASAGNVMGCPVRARGENGKKSSHLGPTAIRTAPSGSKV